MVFILVAGAAVRHPGQDRAYLKRADDCRLIRYDRTQRYSAPFCGALYQFQAMIDSQQRKLIAARSEAGASVMLSAWRSGTILHVEAYELAVTVERERNYYGRRTIPDGVFVRRPSADPAQNCFYQYRMRLDRQYGDYTIYCR